MSTIECLPSPKIAVFTKSGSGFNQEDKFEKVSFFLFFISRPKYQFSILNFFRVNFVAILTNTTRVKYVPLTSGTQQKIFRFHILIDLLVILTLKWNFPFSTTCHINEPFLDFPQLLNFQSAVRRRELENMYVHFGTLPSFVRAAKSLHPGFSRVNLRLRSPNVECKKCL